MWVPRFDQVDLVLSAVGFEGFLARDGGADFVMGLVPDERLAAMLLREAGDNAFVMFPDAADEIGRDAGIERAVPAVGHDVDGNDAVFIGHMLAFPCFIIPDDRRPSGDPSLKDAA